MLRLNVRLDELARERTTLRATNATLESELSSAAAHAQDPDARRAQARARAGRAGADDVRRPRRPPAVSDARTLADRRIRLLLAVARGSSFAIALGARGLAAGRRAAPLAELAATPAPRRRSSCPPRRGTIFDRTGVQLAIGEQTTTVFADPRQIRERRGAVALAADAAARRRSRTTLLPQPRGHASGASSTSRARPTREAAARSRSARSRGRLLLRGAARVPAGAGRARRCSATRASTTGPRRARAAVRRRSSSGRPGRSTSSATRSGARSTSLSTRAEQDGRDVVPDDRPAASRRTPRRCCGGRVEELGAKSATAIVLDPRTGGVLAMAVAPRFDANRFSDTPPRRCSATARSRTPTSPARRSSSSPSPARSRRGS